MKQSTKLLSLVLALVMAFSFVAVIGSAKPGDVTKDKLTYDAVDDAIISPEQGATIILDYLDAQVMPGLGTMDLSVLGKLDLTSIDKALSSIYDLLNSAAVGFLAPSVPDVKALKNGSGQLKNVQRSGGDLNVFYALFNFLGHSDVLGVLGKAPYGLLTDDGINLSWVNGIVAGLVDLSEINGILTNIPAFATRAVYDLLIYGSYGYDKKAEDLNNNLPADVNTIDKQLDQAIAGLLVNPQDYEWVGEGDAAEKVWNMDSLVMPTLSALGLSAVKSDFSLSNSSNTIFALIDKLAPFAIYDLGIQPLNNNLKKELMVACEADVNEITLDKVPADAQADFEVGGTVGKESYVTYISYDKLFHSKVDGGWYYTTLKNQVVLGDDNLPVLDEEGNETTEKVRKYYKINMAAANEFADLINWEWNITAPLPRTKGTGAANEIDYAAIIAEYGSITQALNHLVYIVFTNALTDDVKVDFETTTGAGWVDGATSAISEASGKTIFLDNIERVAKYLLANYADKIFGSDSEYVDWEYSDIEDMTIVELIAYIGPAFFEDVMPQLIMPKNEEGRVAFHQGVQILEFGALVIREFMTEIAPQVNYDSFIFEAGTLTSAGGRQFAEHKAAEWVNIILNMGMDIAVTYLTNITNFSDFCKVQFTDAKADVAQWILDSVADKNYVLGDTRWKTLLDTAILWAVNYISAGGKDTAVLNGITYNAVAAKEGPFNKLSFILNTILPLGFVNGCTSATYDLDVQMLFDRIVDLATNFNLDAIVGLFGRNTASTYNLFNTAPLVKAVLDLANRILALVFRANLLPTTASCAALLTNANLSTIIKTLIGQLKNIAPQLLPNALPVVCKLIRMFGGEQEMGTPKLSLDKTVVAGNGKTFTISNGSEGLWRGYRDAAGNQYKDDQYTYDIVSVKAYNFNDSASSNITGISLDKTHINYGDKATVTFNASAPSGAGAIQKIELTYTVNNEDGKAMADGKQFKMTKYLWLSSADTNAGDKYDTDKQGIPDCRVQVYSNRYISSNPDSVVSAINNTSAYSYSKKDSAVKYTVGGKVDSTQKGIKLYGVQVDTRAELNEYVNFQVVDEAELKAYAESVHHTPGNALSFNIECRAYNTKGTGTSKIIFYDGDSLGKLSSLVGDETSKMRKAAEYNTSGVSYADRILRTSDWSDDQIQQTTSTATAWIDADKNEYAASQVKDIVKTTDDKGNVTAQTGKVTVGGKDVAVKFVTKLDNSAVWTAYVSAIQAGIQGAWQLWNTSSVYNHEDLYKALYIASTEVEYLKLSEEELALLGDSIDADVVALEATVDGIEAQYSDTKDYTDYRMYRWNRYNDARDEASDIISAYKATLRTADDINKSFPYTSIYPSEVSALVKGNKYENYINALLEDNDDETIARNEKDLENAKRHYAGYDALDVAQAENLVTRMAPRLLERTHGKIKTHLANEVASAKAMITNESLYTERSWAIYENALANAEALLADAKASQMQIFDTKWALLVARNGLVNVEDEADYTELEALIAQAEMALANIELYDNTDKEIGQVLAELGHDEFGDRQLFPGSALLVNEEAYAVKDQKYIDRAASALKEALARLKFKGLDIKAAEGNANISTGVLATDNPDTEEIEETITATIATIAAEMKANDVKDLFVVNADKADVTKENITVSNDIYYTIDTDLPGFAGTNSVVTFYTVQDDVKIPVATVRIVVEADVNGDGAVDVLDAAYTSLVATEKAQLEGCYLLAGDLVGDDRLVNDADYGEVVNRVKIAG